MAQTVKLAPGLTAATSTDIVVAAGAEAVVGIYADPGTTLGAAGVSYYCRVMQVTPGADNCVQNLDASTPSVIVRGPNTYRVQRSAAQTNVGVFSE